MAKNKGQIAKIQDVVVARAEVIATMSVDLRRVYYEMIEELNTQAESNIRYYYRTGKRVLEILAAEKELEMYISELTVELDREPTTEEIAEYMGVSVEDVPPDYGPGAIEKIAAAWTVDKSMVYKSKAFAELYPSESEIDDLCGLETSTGQPIGWGHVIQLISVEDSKTRKMLTGQVVEEALTAQQLADVIQKTSWPGHSGGKRRSGGRPFMKPKTVRAGLVQIRTVSGQWVERHREVWAGTEYSVFTELENLPPDELTHEMVDELEQIMTIQAQMQAACAKDIVDVNRLISTIKEVLEEREQEVAASSRSRREDVSAEVTADRTSAVRVGATRVVSGSAPTTNKSS